MPQDATPGAGPTASCSGAAQRETRDEPTHRRGPLAARQTTTRLVTAEIVEHDAAKVLSRPMSLWDAISTRFTTPATYSLDSGLCSGSRPTMCHHSATGSVRNR